MVGDSAFDREALYYAWYLLLNTRGNNGQTLIESLTTRGYFVPFYQLPNDQKPLFFNGKAQAVFDTNALIRDVVYVEAPLDTDHDGQRDLLKVEILRPAETFLPGQDFELADPLLAMRDIHLPMVGDSAFDREALYYAWYLLLNTRGNNGQTLIESLTTRGYFVPFYQLPNDQKPLFFNGKAQAVFDTNALIRDVVYVEAPLDTDHDGQRDLLKGRSIAGDARYSLANGR
ncbi:hypothetical protein WP50_38595, partial [Lactiplantibacillus plantarum]